MTSFIRMPALKAALKAASKLQRIKTLRRRRWVAGLESYNANRLFWQRRLSLSQYKDRQRDSVDWTPDNLCLTDEMHCKDVLTLFKYAEKFVYLDPTVLGAIT